MFALIAAVVALIAKLITTALGTQREQEVEITEGYYNDRAYEQNKTLAYFTIKTEKERAQLIIIGVLAIGVFVVLAIILLRKKTQ